MPNDKLLNLTLADYLDQLATDNPTPGGGSVAALTAALAANLGRMAAAFTLGRPKFAAVEERVRELDQYLANSEQALRLLIDEDASAYDVLSAAFKLPKDDSSRAAQIASAANLAAAVPLEVVALSKQVLRDLMALRAIANPRLLSDVEAGLNLIRAAIPTAAENVRVNLPFMHEPARSTAESTLARLLEDA
jgi:formiminotetrahydrofolate cyclodeaminase